MSIHSNFIYTPLSDILEDAANATQCIGQSIDVFPLCDYIMQSIFMKMTGAQEQKMKCICWELATVDFEIRYDLYNNWTLGECSTLSAKNKTLAILLKAISKIKDDFDPNVAIDKNIILQATKDTLMKFHRNSNINSFSSRDYQEFIKIFDTIEDKCIYQILDNLY